MRVLFLDIDGVLNSHLYWERTKENPDLNVREHYSTLLDSDALALLNGIVEKTGAVIVISSSWRGAHTLGAIQRMFKQRGFQYSECIIGATIDSGGYRTPALEEAMKAYEDDSDPPFWYGRALDWENVRLRGNDIQVWLDQVGTAVTQFAIVDDDCDMAHLSHRHVRTTYEHGLLPEHCDQLVALLTETP